MYKLVSKFDDREELYKRIKGEWVNLAGDETKKVIPANDVKPRREIVARKATQKDLEYLFNKGSKFVVKVEEAKTEIKPTTPPSVGK
jgi:hypothetical protein